MGLNAIETAATEDMISNDLFPNDSVIEHTCKTLLVKVDVSKQARHGLMIHSNKQMRFLRCGMYR